MPYFEVRVAAYFTVKTEADNHSEAVGSAFRLANAALAGTTDPDVSIVLVERVDLPQDMNRKR